MVKELFGMARERVEGLKDSAATALNKKRRRSGMLLTLTASRIGDDVYCDGCGMMSCTSHVGRGCADCGGTYRHWSTFA